VSHEKKLINFSLGLLVLGISQDACAAQPKWRRRTLAERRHDVARRLEDREPNRPYSDREIENKAAERNGHVVWASAYGAGALGCAAARDGKTAGWLAIESAKEGKAAWDAHSDVCEMEQHNAAIEAAKTRS
jgi:hypothetical protein